MSEPTIFCFFPLASVGGTELVHLDVLKALGASHKEIYIRYKVNPWKGMAFKATSEARNEGIQLLSSFKLHGSVTFLSSYLEAPRLGRLIRSWYVKRLARRINSCPNALVLFWHRESIEFLWPYLDSNVRIIDIVHNNSNNQSPDAHYLLNDWAPRINRRVLVNGGLKKWILPLYAAANYPDQLTNRISTINHTVTIPDELPNKSTSVFNVLFVGRDSKEKRVELFLEITKRLAHIPFIQFHLIGIEREVAIGANLTSHGVLIDRAQIESKYARAHVLVLTSESEGFPKVIAEAMAFGCIPIATAVGAIPEMLSHGEYAFLTDPKQCVEETIEHIERLSQDPADFTERSKKAYFYAKNHFDSERFNVEWRALIQSLG